MGLTPDTAGSLDALVSGRRCSPRISVSIDVRIKARHAEFDARLADISVEGALVQMDVAALAGRPDGALDASMQFTLVEKHFRESFDIHFPEHQIVVEAQLMRLAMSTNPSSPLGLGCKFMHPLSAEQQRKLGMKAAAEGAAQWDEVIAGLDLRWAAAEGMPVSAMLLDALETISGPVFMGPVTRVGRQAIVVRVDAVKPEEARTRMSTPDAAVRVMRGSRVLLATGVNCPVARYVDAPRPGAELLLELGVRVPRAMRRHFKVV